MTPGRAKSENDVADAVERWEEEEREYLRLAGDEGRLPDQWRKAALECILTGRVKESVELREIDTSGGFKTYDELRGDVMRWASRKRMDKQDKRIEQLETKTNTLSPEDVRKAIKDEVAKVISTRAGVMEEDAQRQKEARTRGHVMAVMVLVM